MLQILTRNLPTIAESTFTRRADFRPDSFNRERRTVEVTFSDNTVAQRAGYEEILSHEPGAVDLHRLVGAHVLDSHRRDSVGAVIGVVRAARVENGQGIAVIELDDQPDLLRKIESGILRHVSVGYVVTKSKDVINGGNVRRKIATHWRPFEISFVTAPVGNTTHTRNQNMPELNTDPPENDRAALRGQIRIIAQSAGLTREWADEQIDAEHDLTEVRAAAFEAMTTRSRPQIRVHHTGVSNDDPAVIRERRAGALVSRMLGTTPHADVVPYMADRVVDHAAWCLESQGIHTRGMSPQTIFERAFAPMTTSDFPLLMGQATNMVLLEAYTAAASPLKALGRQALHADFKGRTLIRVGELSELQRVTEAGEIKHQVRGESGTIYALDTYAGLISYSRKLMINDSLGGLADTSTAQGQAAATTEANLLTGLLLQAAGLGPLMYDGKRLFHVDHGNLGTAAALSVASLSAARLAMRSQKGLDGTTPISVVPKYLLVGPELETLAEQLLATLNATVVDEQNPFAQKLTLLVDPRIVDGSWYLAAANPVTLEYAYLSSAPGPQLATREGWDVLGMEFRVVLDFGAGFVDWRGIYRNPGV